MATSTLAKNMYLYSDVFLRPFCDLHLNLENYTDKNSKDYYTRFLLIHGEHSILENLECLNENELIDCLTKECVSMNEDFVNKIKGILDEIPNWDTISNAYNSAGDLEFLKGLINGPPPDKVDYTKIIQTLRNVEEAYHRACSK